MINTRRIILAGAVGALLFSMPSFGAQIINGAFSGTGFATVSFTNLNFCPNGQTPNGTNVSSPCISAVGNVGLAGGSGSFLGVAGSLNQIQSLNQTTAPIGTLVNIPNWLVFSPAVGSPPTAVGSPPISLTLTEVLPGSFSSAQCGAAPVSGQICTPVGSAFNLSNQAVGPVINASAATFEVIGNAVSSDGSSSPFAAIFSSQFNVPYQTLLAALATGNGTGNYSSSYSVSIQATPPATVPEPMTLSMMGMGLVGIGLIARRRKV